MFTWYIRKNKPIRESNRCTCVLIRVRMHVLQQASVTKPRDLGVVLACHMNLCTLAMLVYGSIFLIDNLPIWIVYYHIYYGSTLIYCIQEHLCTARLLDLWLV